MEGGEELEGEKGNHHRRILKGKIEERPVHRSRESSRIEPRALRKRAGVENQ